MELTVAEALRLEGSLLREGELCDQNWDLVVADANAWFKHASTNSRAGIDTDLLATLCESIRYPSCPKAQLLAAGAILMAMRHGISEPGQARLAVRFAVHQLREFSGIAPMWSTIPLSPAERNAADEIFSAAIGDTRIADDQLTQAANAFLRATAADTTLFRQLSGNLSRLVNLLCSPDTPVPHRDIARAALAYFARIDDVIPDDGGVTGFLDDAYVASRAVASIDQNRGFVMDKLDKLVANHPIFCSVRFDGGNSPPSEFALLNTYIALRNIETEEQSSRASAVVCPAVGPIPLIVGFLTALAKTIELARDKGVPAFGRGEYLVNSESGAKVVFDSFARATEAGAMIECDASDATHFCFDALSKNRQSAKKIHRVRCHRKISDIFSFRRAATEGPSRSSKPVFDSARLALGPLEQLLGLTKPIVLPAVRLRIVVTASLAESRAAMDALTVGGSSLKDFLPTGQARVTESGLEYKNWSSTDDGRGPILTFVRTTADAAAVVDEPDSHVAAVIANVRAGSTDAVAAARIASRNIPIVAFMDERSSEELRALAGAGFTCWAWDRLWLKATERAASDSGVTILDDFERRLRVQSDSTVVVEHLDENHLGNCHQHLLNLQAAARDDHGESLREIVGEGFGLLSAYCRFVRQSDEAHPYFEERLTSLRTIIGRAQRWLDDDELESIDGAVAGFEAALCDLAHRSPKFEAIASWASRSPSGVIIAPKVHHETLQRSLDCNPRLLRETLDGTAHDALVVAWLRRDKMDRLLFPPVASNVTAVFYQPEIAWYRSAEHRHSSAREQALLLAAQRPAMRGAVHVSLPTRVVATEMSEPPDELIAWARRARAVHYLRGLEGDRVPARLVQFAGGHWAAFTEFHRLHSVTHLLDGTGDDDVELREITAANLADGERLVMLKGTNRDALRDEVDRIAPTGLRDQATVWQAAMRKVAETVSSDGLLRRLEEAGCKRTRATMIRWLNDDSMIGPRSTTDVQNIAIATGDVELKASIAKCQGAISQLRGLHVTVAQSLAKRVVARVQEWLAAGGLPEELVEVEEQIVIVTVESIDSELIQVPRGSANRLQLAF